MKQKAIVALARKLAVILWRQAKKAPPNRSGLRQVPWAVAGLAPRKQGAPASKVQAPSVVELA